ncbi:amidophosphoribosyltransferase [Polaribacter reichenbachii]|uniref:Amidophosphoribosyltransferase n=1 Tax=Polaribacter reichenbachii TaxID=996801 RepID=A0A1B8U697_9FLAO|nr:ComF family protein [Polaribacter reichenbachii]APZ46175.1 amidophosphoribosyltransferase [Polaribacter reichenbachii]AUC20037.1 amidophosphoribosyltransferase [Polaribacter reichenbachii]OBY67416.1 amidophosphoribosyltransferase [Polaribacter reichenbachii]
MRLLKDLFYIFYPKLCVVCDENLIENENVLCTLCRHDLSLTNFNSYQNNKITQAFYGSIIIEKAYALLYYRKEGSTLNLIHDLKYKGNEEIGVFFGNWLGEMLKENNEFKNVDCIIPVPLHPKKLRERGYNQVTKFGERLSFYLNVPLIENELIRISSTKTQTFKSRFERFINLDTKFSLKNPSKFNNKHILLIDDVITTGATLKACAKEFQKSKNCRISILTMAYTE